MVAMDFGSTKGCIPNVAVSGWLLRPKRPMRHFPQHQDVRVAEDSAAEAALFAAVMG